MVQVALSPEVWAAQQFSECELGDLRRNKTLVKVATHMAIRPDGTTPVQTENWSVCKSAYRLFNEEDVTFQEIARPHYELTRAITSGPVKLLISDTTELDFGAHRQVEGLGPTGNGGGLGFFLHSCLMLDAKSGAVEGMAGQRLFYRRKRTGKKPAGDVRRKSPDRESAVWGKLVDDVGLPPEGVRWIHLCDRGADDYEVFCRILRNNGDFVIRAARLNRKIMTLQGERQPLEQYLRSLRVRSTLDVDVPLSKKHPARRAHCQLRFGPIQMPRPRIRTDWMRKHAPQTPIPLWVIEVREVNVPKGVAGLHWVLYVSFPIKSVPQARTAIGYYRRRPTIEDFHKGLKTGCRAEQPQYQTARALERVTAVNCVIAVRLLQIKTIAQETPDRPAKEVVPPAWLSVLKQVRPRLRDPITVRDFLRQLAGLGGHLGRKGDGEPGWITIWRGMHSLLLILRGYDLAARKKSG